MKKIALFLLLLNTAFLFAQKEITGVVKDKSGAPLPGVNILEKGTSNGVSTDFEGGYMIKVKEGATLIFSYVGYGTIERATSSSKIDVALDESGGQVLNDVVVVGSRNAKRTVVNSAVPIDIINVKDVTTQSGKLEINELLQYVNRKVRCEHCEYFDEDDSECLLFRMLNIDPKVNKDGCCNAQTPEDDKKEDKRETLKSFVR